MYYTHEYSNEIFNTWEECKEDLLANLSVDDYYEHLDSYNILVDFFRRKSNDDFCQSLENYICEVEQEIETDYILHGGFINSGGTSYHDSKVRFYVDEVEEVAE